MFAKITRFGRGINSEQAFHRHWCGCDRCRLSRPRQGSLVQLLRLRLYEYVLKPLIPKSNYYGIMVRSPADVPFFYVVQKGDRIAQLILEKIVMAPIVEVEVSFLPFFRSFFPITSSIV